MSYKAIGLPIRLDKLAGEDGAIYVSRSYTNPMNGIQSLAFCNKVSLVDSEDASRQREAVLLRVIPTDKLKDFCRTPSSTPSLTEASLSTCRS